MTDAEYLRVIVKREVPPGPASARLLAIADRIEAAERDAERYRDGLRWYADGHHYSLEDWEDCSGETANWLFPPMDVEKSWMVDDGGIARAILDMGHTLNPNHAEDDNITIPPTAVDAAMKAKP